MTYKKRSSGTLSTEEQLRQIIPHYPKVLDNRILPFLDQYCLEIIRHASLVVVGSNNSEIPITVFNNQDLQVIDETKIQLPIRRLSTKDSKSESKSSASLYFLVPGIGHGLRVNGRLKLENDLVHLAVTGAYVHCARAAARSGLWESSILNSSDNPDNPENSKVTFPSTHQSFLQQSSFLLLKTMNERFETELSPRGDETGFLKMINDHALFIPERPGNKVAVSLRNILKNSSIELLMFKPGCLSLMRVKGSASVTTDGTLLDSSIVNNKRPKLGIKVENCEFEIFHSDALDTNAPWLASSQKSSEQLTRFSSVLSTHMNGKGLLAKVATPVVQMIVNHDMKNLY